MRTAEEVSRKIAKLAAARDVLMDDSNVPEDIIQNYNVAIDTLAWVEEITDVLDLGTIII